MAYIGVSPQNGVRKKHTYTASGSQTDFTGAGAEGITLSYKDSNFVDVYQNGVKLAEADYQSTTGTTIVLDQGAAANDIVEIIVYDVFSTSDMVSASDGGTFAGNVAMSGTLTLTGNGDFNGDLDVDGTLETDALTINGVTLAETISDTVGAMVSGNTETGITVTYDDSDNTLDFIVGTLNQDTTGTAANATLAATVTVTDSNANNNFPIVFHDESNALLDDTGALRYNPSTGELLVPKLTVAGTTTTVDTVTMNAANAVVFEGASANDHETTLTIVDPTADRTINLPNVSGTIPVLAAASNTAITSTPAEINLLDGSVANTVVNSKAVIYGSSGELAGALSTAAQPNVTSLGTLTTLTVDDITINGSTISDSGDFTLDIGGDIILDADGKDYLFKDGGTLICTMSSDNTDFTIRSEVQDRDLKFEGNDNGSVITALTLDMSAAGAATFNSTIGTPAGSASAPSHTFSSDTNTGMFKRGTDQIGFTAGGTEALAITSGGIFADTIGNKTSNGDLTLDIASDLNIDVDDGRIFLKDGGTTFGRLANASTDFEIVSVVQDKDILFKGNDNGSEITALTLDMSAGGNATFNNSIAVADGDASAPGYRFKDDLNNGMFRAGTDIIGLSTAGAERLRIDSVGRVMIAETSNSGYSNNADDLIVGDNGSSTERGISFGSTLASTIRFNDGSDAGIIEYVHSDNSMRFGTNDGSERMRILGDGDVAINATATAIGGFSAAHLLVDTDSGRNSITVGSNRQNGVAYGIQADGSSGIRYAMYIINGGGGEVGKITYTSSAVTYATTSDYRLKQNISYDFDATTRLKQLKPCRFNFIADADNTIDGFLAHEVSHDADGNPLVPEAIVGEKDAMFEEVLYVDGDEIPDGKKIGDVKEASKIAPQSIDHSKLVPLLTKALQEQQATIEALTARITALESA
jgi:hypothetical protein